MTQRKKTVPLVPPPHTHKMDIRELCFQLFVCLFYALVCLDSLVTLRLNPGALRPSSLTLAKWHPLPAPDHEDLIIAYKILAVAAAFTAFTPRCYFRFFASIVAVAKSFSYFGTVLNRFQHVYFISLVLWLLVFAQDKRSIHARWTLHMQLAIMYFFTAVAKLDGHAFMNGDILSVIFLSRRNVQDAMTWTANLLFVDQLWIQRGLACSVILGEFVVAFLWATGKKPGLLLLLGLVFHLGVRVAGIFKVGFFTEYMLLCYLIPMGDVLANLTSGVSSKRDSAGKCRHLPAPDWLKKNSTRA